MQRSEGRACQTERQWDAQIKTVQNRRGRDSKTSVICNSLMFNGCSWIKNFKLLSARWKRRREEGGRDRRGAGGGGGTSEQHIYICISTLHLVIRGKNQLPPKILWGRRIYYLFSSSTNIRKQFPSFVCPDACLHLPGQLGFGLWEVIQNLATTTVTVQAAGLWACLCVFLQDVEGLWSITLKYQLVWKTFRLNQTWNLLKWRCFRTRSVHPLKSGLLLRHT